MDRGHIVRTGRLAVVLLGSATLTACMTPQYAARGPVGYAPEVPAKAPPAPRGHYKTGDPYQVGGIWYVPHEQPNYDQTGVASWYGDAFQMKATANGEIFDMNQFSAAHTTLPLPSMVEVTNLDNGRKLTVRVNDRGPFVGARIIDLSHAAARELGYDRQGTARVRVRYVGPAPLGGPEAGVRIARATAPAYLPAKAVRPADEDIFAAATPAATAPIGTPPRRGLQVEVKPLVAPPEPVSVSTLSPLAQFARSDALAAETGVYRIQAGAFADRAHARRAADQLSAQGVATVEPFDRGGTTLYRVLLPGPTDEAEAYALRDKVAQSGFADARVVRPSTF
ncbi:MAG: rare lipoprotein [Phenylobacterium sp.]|jgi:rare lipoprotein A|uniref:septal ring lytic transglycosylase RlpA family protein n=1 Tax=Phenylobacterium sp. TaxID=1871053 RepID=UPI00262EADBD|nr:septal ring lytic transglycosylase RlpA family protein [Phenylobacterium sp.]MDB5496275.1 rare lipoprotein [Phenylobacterium sp.]